jgi:HEAT repeat protein
MCSGNEDTESAELSADELPMSTGAPIEARTLYYVATPIGNLEDITLRAVRTLREVDVVATEDTRVTLGLLRHLHIGPKKLVAHHDHNLASSVPKLIELLQSAEDFIRKEAAWAVANVANEGDAGQIAYLVQQGAIPPLCKLLGSHDDVIKPMLVGLESIFNKLSKLAPWIKALEDFKQCSGAEIIENLLAHDNEGIAALASAIMGNYRVNA